MFKVTRCENVNELIKLWPRLLKLAQADVPAVNPEQLLQLYLTCLSDGVLLIVRNDAGLAGVCCAELSQDGTSLFLRSVPNDKGTGIAKASLATLKGIAREYGCRDIQVTTSRFCGSSYKFFEKCLGFHRHSVTFKMKLDQ